MFSQDELEKIKALEEQWQRDCSETYGEREFKPAIASQCIPLKPVYSPMDIEDSNIEDIGFPGEYPYTRGPKPRGYQATPWVMRQPLGHGAGNDTRGRWEYLRKAGWKLHAGKEGEGEQFPRFSLNVDHPTRAGYDPDDPESQGKVGEGGVSVSTVQDMALLFDGLPLDQIIAGFILYDTALVITAMYLLYAEQRGYSKEKMRMECSNLVYRQWFYDSACFSPEAALKLIVENINYRIKHMPMAYHTNITGYVSGEAGANHVQQIAFGLATAITITEECIKAGLNPEDVAPGFYHQAHVGQEFFEDIAKYRAFRRMWAKTFKERFGCERPDALKILIKTQTGGVGLTLQEPLNNIVRLTLATLSSVLGGVDAIWTAGYDEAICIPTEEAAQIALRTQQIIYHETNIPGVADPLGGSYYVEWLTNKMEEEAWNLLDKVGQLGGYLDCWKTGWLRAELERSAYEHFESLRTGERVLVGVNKYRLEQEPQKVGFFEVDPNMEPEAIDRVRRFKAERDNAETQQALAQLKATTETWLREWPASCGTLMPAIMDAVKANATLGEAQGVLREVCGYGYF